MKLGDLKNCQQKEPRASLLPEVEAGTAGIQQPDGLWGVKESIVSPQFCAKVPLTRVKTEKIREYCII